MTNKLQTLDDASVAGLALLAVSVRERQQYLGPTSERRIDVLLADLSAPDIDQHDLTTLVREYVGGMGDMMTLLGTVLAYAADTLLALCQLTDVDPHDYIQHLILASKVPPA